MQNSTVVTVLLRDILILFYKADESIGMSGADKCSPQNAEVSRANLFAIPANTICTQ